MLVMEITDLLTGPQRLQPHQGACGISECFGHGRIIDVYGAIECEAVLERDAV